jgi:hypothetical protein
MDRTQSRGAGRRRAGACALTLTGALLVLAGCKASSPAAVGHAPVSVPQSSSSARAIIASTDVGAILIGPLS